MNDEIKSRLAKIYELVKRGATEGERAAAKKALDRLMQKYNLDSVDLESIDRKAYWFKYVSKMEERLLIRLLYFFVEDSEAIFQAASKDTYGCRDIYFTLTYLDYVTLDSAYEYFRRHMKAQWQKLCAPELKKCRKTKTRNKKRKKLQAVFYERYIIASNLVDPKNLAKVDLTKMSLKEIEELLQFSDIEGGAYNRQVVTGNLLAAHTQTELNF
ncbi:MAG: DUF2786 domain-containing protein [Cyclobacteriaceae bacterium]